MGGVGGVNDLLPFVVIGLTAGSVYGLAGTGLVLTYKTSGVFNFAYGAIAAVAAFVFYFCGSARASTGGSLSSCRSWFSDR